MARKKKRDSDFAVTAYRVVDHIIKNTETIGVDAIQIEGKNPHAVALGRVGGLKRSSKQTPEQRKELARKAARARWERKKEVLVMLNKDASLELTCPKCSGKFNKTIRELEGNPIVDCPNGHKVHIKSDDLVKGLKDVENSLAKFKKDIGKMLK